MHRALFMPHEDVLDLVLLEERVVDGPHRASRIAEQMLHALINERGDHHFGTAHFLVHFFIPCFNAGNKKGPLGAPDAHRRSPRLMARDGSALPYYNL